MKKKSPAKVLSACVCSVCGQTANAQVGTTHFFCIGIKLAPGKRMPTNLKFPNKGTWVIPASKEAETKVA